MYYSGKFEEALPHVRRALELDADDRPAYTLLAQAYEALGKPEEAVKLLEGPRFKDSPPLALAYAAAGRRAEALKIVQTVAAAPNPPPRQLALVYFALGDDDRGFVWLTKSLDIHEAQAPSMGEPRLNRVRSDPRFQALLARLRFPPQS